MDFSELRELTIPDGQVFQILDAESNVLWRRPTILQVKKITSDTYASSTTYNNESFILLNIYPLYTDPLNVNSHVTVKYGGKQWDLDFTGSNAKSVYFGTFNGDPQYADTPDEGALIIEGEYSNFTVGSFNPEKNSTSYCGCITDVVRWGISSIYSYAFRSCINLTSLEIPDFITNIGFGAFDGCKNLTSVRISSVANWCEITFGDLYANPLYYAKNLYVNDNLVTNLSIPSGVASISEYAFYNCSSITSIEIPASVTSIGNSTFRGCSNLAGVYISDITSWCGIDFNSYESNPLYYAKNLYLNNSLITELLIPEGAVNIGSYAFYGCDYIASVAIPNSLASIGEGAFGGCTSVANVYISDLAKWCEIDFAGAESQPMNYSNLYVNGTLLTDLLIPENTTTIKPYSFSGCACLNSVIINNNVVNIGDGAFYGCAGLTNIDIPNSVVNIGDGAFYNCSSLNSIILPDSITEISDHTFALCSSLVGVEIPNSIVSIGTQAFIKCTSLTHVVIPEDTTYIGEYAFQGCSNLEYINIPDSITVLNKYVISRCPKLTTIILPNSITAIEEGAFWENTGLKSIIIPSSVISIGNSAFNNCTRLSSVEIPDSVTSIGGSAFIGCTNLASVSIGNNVSDIKVYAFSDCPNLIKITLPKTPPSLASANAFENNHASRLFYVPLAEDIAVYEATRQWSSFAGMFNTINPISITFNANGGTGTMEVQTAAGRTNINTNLFIRNGYYFTGWNTSADGSGVAYVDNQLITPANSNITLYAQWSNQHALTYKHSNKSGYYQNTATGHQEIYELRINGVDQGKRGAFTNAAQSIPCTYGDIVEVACTWWDDGCVAASVDIYYPSSNSVSNNGSNRPSGYYPYGSSSSFKFSSVDRVAYLKFKVLGDITVNFISKTNAPAIINKEAYWDCEISGNIEII